jgi:hypothetical protein
VRSVADALQYKNSSINSATHLCARVPITDALLLLPLCQSSSISNWQTYELTTELTAAAIYFYITFVMLGSLFLGAVAAMQFIAVVATLYASIGILNTLF